MPVTIRQATIGFKDENGNYIRTNSLVEQTVEAQVGSIQQMGATQVTAVQNAGSTAVQSVQTEGSAQIALIQSANATMEQSVFGSVVSYPLISGRMINSSGKWANSAANKYAAIPLEAGDIITIKAGRGACYFAFLASGDAGTSTVDYATGETGRRSIAAGEYVVIGAPENTHLLYLLYQSSSNTAEHWPYRLLINGVDKIDSVAKNATEISDSARSMTKMVFGSDTVPEILDGNSISSGTGSNCTWLTGSQYHYAMIPIEPGDKIAITANSLGVSSAFFAFLAYPRIGNSTEVLFASGETGRRNASPGTRVEMVAPAGSRYLYVLHSNTTGSGDYYFPEKIVINGVPIVDGVVRSRYGVFTYSEGSFLNGVADKQLLIALPRGNHYVSFTMYHYHMEDSNCDVWRVFSFDKLDSVLNGIESLSAKGELECAVSLDGRSDFSGGSTHGDEIMTGWDLFLDGKRITDNIAGYTQATPFRELRLVRKSVMYDPNDSVTEIADHGCEYVYTMEGLTINQSLKWRGAYQLSNCYMAMFTPKKTVTDHFYTDTEYTPVEVNSDNYSMTKAGAKKIVIYGESSGFMGEFSIERYPTGMTGGDRALITDNSGNAYNKCYFYICTGGTTSENELWQTTTKYKLQA